MVVFILGFGKPVKPEQMPQKAWDVVRKIEDPHASHSARQGAAWIIAQSEELRHETVLPFVIKWLKNKEDDSVIRKELATALGKWGDERAVRPLFEALAKESSGDVKDALAKGLYSTGVDLRVAAEKGVDLKEKHAKALVEVHQLLNEKDSPSVIEGTVRAALEGNKELRSVEGASKFMQRLRNTVGHSL
jgi:HEAT repeat protein